MAATYVDSSAIVKLAVREPQSDALRKYLRRRRPLISSALARTEVLPLCSRVESQHWPLVAASSIGSISCASTIGY